MDGGRSCGSFNTSSVPSFMLPSNSILEQERRHDWESFCRKTCGARGTTGTIILIVQAQADVERYSPAGLALQTELSPFDVL